jgi:hypothetical protein
MPLTAQKRTRRVLAVNVRHVPLPDIAWRVNSQQNQRQDDD